MATKKLAELTATNQGFQKPFEVKGFTLGELLEMKTSTSVAQTPLNLKNVAVLRDNFRTNEMVTPFAVARFDNDFYLAGGRHRAFTHKDLDRALTTIFYCIFYEVETAAELNELIIQLNAARKTTGTEKKLLRLGGELGLRIGEESLEEVYASYLLIKDNKSIYQTLKTDLVARLLNADQTDIITDVMMLQLVNAVWVNSLGLGKYKNYLYLLTYDIKNITAFIDMAVPCLTESFEMTVRDNPHITRWARDGKAVLASKAASALLYRLADVFPVLPQAATKSKAPKKDSKAPVATVTVADKIKESNAVPVEPVVETVEVTKVLEPA
jgi:hypothetical protein